MDSRNSSIEAKLGRLCSEASRLKDSTKPSASWRMGALDPLDINVDRVLKPEKECPDTLRLSARDAGGVRKGVLAVPSNGPG